MTTTDKDFVLSIYSTAVCHETTIESEDALRSRNFRYIIVQEINSSWVIDGSYDSEEDAWKMSAEFINRRMLRKLES